MLRLISKSDKGNFTVGKLYRIEEINSNGHPILKDNDKKLIDIWDERGFIPGCWGNALTLTEKEVIELGIA